jgi:adenylate cyclase
MVENLSRKLAVLLHADVAASTTLVQLNETIAHERMRDAFMRFSEIIKKYDGIAHEIRGDALVAEFPRASDAVSAALEFQVANNEYNNKISDDVLPILRVGIAMGEVVIADNTVTGEGIVLAQRLEQLAEPGAVCIQGAAYETMPMRLPFQFTDLGEQFLKGIMAPVRAYVVAQESDASISKDTQPVPSTVSKLELPDKPSIAVLPFDNMSGDPDQEYFADGITEDIITALSKFRWFFVIARNSTFVYKGRAVDVNQVGRDLGVRYVLEGSVRKSANRLRITAQLIEAETGNHVWAERYDRNLTDIFELQDEITSTIAAAVEPELAGSERDRAIRKPTDDLGAWDLFQRGAALMWSHDRARLQAGMGLVKEAIELDSSFGRAYGHLAFGAFLLLVYEWVDDRDEGLRQGLVDANKAIDLDRRDYFAYCALGRLNTVAGNHAVAVRALETSVNINPNFALGYVGLGEAHVYGGDPNKAIAYADIAIRFSPSDLMMWDMLHYKASAYVRLDKFDQAIEIFERVCEYPSAQYVPSATLAALYVIQGQNAEGQKALQNAYRLEPGLSLDMMKNVYGISRDRPGTRSQRLLDALRSIGLKEQVK